MKALFELTPDCQVEIEPNSHEHVVYLRKVDGLDYSTAREPFTPTHPDSGITMTGLTLTKAQARAIGSALMGAAAEV